MKKLLFAAAGVLLVGHAQLAIGDQEAGDKGTLNYPAVVATRIQNQLASQYPLAKTTADGGDLIAAGVVLVLQKDNLVLNKVYMSGTHRSSPVENVFENDAVSQLGLSGALSSINVLLSTLGGVEAQSRSFGRGEKLWVTKIAVQSDGIVFSLMSDPLNNMRYHGSLKFPYSDIASADKTAAVIASVLAKDSPRDPSSGADAQGTSAPGTSASQTANESDEIRRAAEAGDVSAMYQVGNMAAQQGANVDAARWFRSASDRGHVKATNALGFLYEEGKGVPQNYAQANNLYLRAMKQGNADAMVNRGLMYANGFGVSKDPVQAYMHFLLGAAYAQDQETRDTVVKLRDETAAKLSKQQLARGQVMADKFAQRDIK